MKKFNLIKRLLSYSHEKQKPQRFGRYAVMLMMLLTLGVGQMWADWTVSKTIYFDFTAVPSGQVMYSSGARGVFTTVDGAGTVKSFTFTGQSFDGNCMLFKTEYGGWAQQNWTDPGDNNCVKVSSDGVAWSWTTYGGGGGGGTLTEMTDAQVKAVLDDGKVMVYLGCGTSANYGGGSSSGAMALQNGSSTTNVVSVTTSQGGTSAEPWFYWKEVTTALSVGSSGTYYLSNNPSGWSGLSITASLIPGAVYFMNDSWNDRSGVYSDHVFYITSPSASIPTTARSVTEGNSITVTTTLTAGYRTLPKSAVGTTMNLKFFAKDSNDKFWVVGDNTSLSSSTPQNTTLSGVAELDPGTYTIYAALYDSRGVYIKATNTFTLTVNVQTYTLTYDGNGKDGGGAAPSDASSPYNRNSTVTVKDNINSMTKDGYHFAGWNTKSDYSGTDYAPGATFSIEADMTLYAKWVKTIYVYDNLLWNSMKLYTWDSNNGNKEYNGAWSGESLSQIGTSKWYQVDIVSGPNKLILNNGSAQTEDITIADYSPSITDGHSYETYDNSGTKKLREKTLTVSFNMKSHGGDAPSSQNKYYNELATAPSPAPSETGYDFGGWYKETGCTNAWNFATDKVTAATTLYAKWTANQYYVPLAANHASALTGGSANVNYDGTSLSILTTPTMTGYHVTGYYKEPETTNLVADAEGSFGDRTVSGLITSGAWTCTTNNTSLYTGWAINTYTVEFNNNGGTGSISDQDFTYGVAQFLTSNNGSITRDGYFFDGWATSPEGDRVYTNGQSVSNLTTENGGTVTLYAHWSQVPALSSVTATPASYNYVGEDITLNLSATSTYLAHPIVVFFVNDGVATYQVTAAAYGDGDDAVGTIGSDAAYTTVHKATFAVKAAGTYSVTAKLYEGILVDNFEGTNTKGWAADNLGDDGAISFGANNPGRMAGNGSSKVLQITRAGEGAQQWGGAILLFVANTVEAKTTCDATGSNDYEYIHARMKDATDATHLKNNDNSSDSNNADIEPSFTGDASADWRHVTYHNTHCSNNFLFFMIQRDNTENKTVYIDDVILSDNETWAPVKDEEDEDVTADASPVVINQTYDISIVGGRVASDNSATSVKASADVTNPLAGTAYVAAGDVESGMKFTGWKLSTGVSLKEGSTLTSRSIEFYAVGNGTVTAQYEKRNKVDVYFAAVDGWTPTYAYAWEAANTSNKNATYPGVSLTTVGPYDGVTYYHYGYYTESDGADDDAEGDAAWDYIVFNNGDGTQKTYPESYWNKTRALQLVNGHYYHFEDGDANTLSGSAYYYDWYVRGSWNGEDAWEYSHPIDFTGATIVRDLNAQEQLFKVFRASTNQWFKYDPTGTSNTNVAALIGSAMELREYNDKNNKFTPSERSGYQFSLVKDNTSPTLTIQKMTDQDISVTVEAGANGSITTGPSTIHLYTTTTITAAANAGYRFEKWTVDDAHKSYIHIEDTLSASTKVYAKYGSLGNGATITAHFTNKGFIYFDKTDVMSKWAGDNVYITFFKNNSHWTEYYDGKDRHERVYLHDYVDGLMSRKMERISETNIYYLDYHEYYDNVTGYFAFHDTNLPAEGQFYYIAGVARGDFDKTSNNLFVVEDYVEKTVAHTGYFYGYWMKYREEEAGVKVSIYDGSDQPLYGSPFAFTREDLSTNTFTSKVKLNGSSTYRIELLGDNGIYYKNNGTYNTTNAGTYWEYVERQKTVGHITTTGEGEYTFTLNCTNQLKMAAAYPLHAGDYRIVYNGRFNTDSLTARDFNGSPIAQWKTGDGTKIDKVSFYVIDTIEAGNTMDWKLKVQSCSIAGTTVTWNDVAEKEFTFSTLKGDTGVYVFDVKQTSASDITIENPVAYTGDFYIRTDIADGRWEAYKEAENNKMVHSDWAEANCDYNYYHCHYTPSGKSVKFTIANDYSSSISGELNSDDYTTGDGKLNANANVRFSYNSATNVIKRAYIGGSIDDTYLNIVSPTAGCVYASNGTTDLNGASASTRKFVDMGNWVYQLDIQAYPTSQAKVTAYYKGQTQYLIGSAESSETIIGGDKKGSDKYKLRTVYDFKNNHLITSWLADGKDIGESLTLNADLMIVRRLQNAGVQIHFTDDALSLSNIKTIYGAIQFDYNDMVNTMPNWSASGIYGKVIYYISFPFDVNVKDIFGSAGNMEDQWIIQSYNGARRAKEGWFADSKPFWETLTVDSVMKAGRGYALIIDRPSFNDPSSVVWTNKSAGSSVYLYFPSHNADAATIGKDTKTVTVPPHKCNIQRSFYNSSSMLVSHTQTDSHWNMMGIPLFENKVASTVVADSAGFNYFYDWNAGTNSYEVMNTSITQFKAMHGYMVQFTGTVTFTGAALNPSVAARRLADNKKYLVELLMTNENDIHSRTYVELRENACDTFLLNEDVYMMRSSTTVDLFTLAGNYDVAANVLPIQNHTVPVGMDVKQAGMYTFSMPSNFSGTVTLLDTQAGTRTNLAISDYEVYLDRGTINNRFYLELNIQESTTSLEDINGEGSIKDGNAHKFLKNGVLYILKDGVVYDAKGNRVK